MALRPFSPDQKRFADKVRFPTESAGCWIWLGSYDSRGRGQFRLYGKMWKAHRASYVLFKGPIPTGLDLDHTCVNRGCVNPGHLEPVTHRENMLRGDTIAARNARKTHCPQGHEYSQENTILRNGKRECRTCKSSRRTRS